MTHPTVEFMRSEAALVLSKPRADEDSTLFVTVGWYEDVASLLEAADALVHAADPGPELWDLLEVAVDRLRVYAPGDES